MEILKPSRARRFLVHGALAAGSIAATLFFLEAGVRIVKLSGRNYLDELVHYRPTDGQVDLALADLIRPVDDDLIVYELRPGVRGQMAGREVSINALGMRDVERTPEKPEGVFRIVGLGDSHMFGWGVEREETFLALLEEQLNRRYPARRFEALPLAVPGYNTVQEVQDFSRRAELLSPDLVIINYVDNDMDLPNFLSRRPDLGTLRKSYLLELLRRRIGFLRGESLPPPGLFGVAADIRTRRFRMRAEEIPARFRPLYGWDNMFAAYRRLARLAKERGIPYVVLFNMDNYSNRLLGRTPTVLYKAVRDLAQLCREEGYLVVDPQDRIARYLEEHGLNTRAVWISPRDSHTNPLRHRLVAEELLEKLEDSGFLRPGA